MNNSLIREIKEEARKDKITKLLAKNKSIIIKVIIGLFIILVAYFIYEYNQGIKERKFSETFHQAIIYEQTGKVDDSIILLEEIYKSSSAPSDLKAISSLRLAAAYLSQEKSNKALEIYEKIAFGSGYDKYIRELSSLLLSKLIVHNLGEEVSEDRYRSAIIRIKKLINKSDILRTQLEEQLAILYIKIEQEDEARKILEKIKTNPNSSIEQQKRIADLIKIIS